VLSHHELEFIEKIKLADGVFYQATRVHRTAAAVTR